ncbi:MAG: hypothetical protein MPN21_11815 [Thermoanaerobaculia bacterium]|nr:hypothetical protein [Thermoanaerobaculia bacterium]
MPLPEPTIDHRTYRQLVSEALSRVPAHTPEWTHLGDADPGVTLLQLFAFMGESVIYRANRIPERNRRKFLRLLGIPLRAAEAAEGLVSFSIPRGRLEAVSLEADRELFAGQVPFRTEAGLDVLPVEAQIYTKSPLDPRRRDEVESLYRRLHASLEVAGSQLDFYETRPYETPDSGVTLPVLDFGRRPSPPADPDDGSAVTESTTAGQEPAVTGEVAGTVDGALWLALLARPREDPDAVRQVLAGRVLTLGVLPALDADGCVLGSAAGESVPSLVFEHPDVGSSSADVPRYRRLTPRGDADLLARPGVVELPLPTSPDDLRTWQGLGPQLAGTGGYPPSLEETDEEARLVTWIRIRLPESAPGQTAAGLAARVSWVGINAARVVQRASVLGELLPRGTGEPDQLAALVHTPVLVDTARVTVNGELWQRIDDLSAAGPEVPERSPRLASESDEATAGETVEDGGEKPVKVFTVDRESGEIRFGDGARGMRPPAGSTIQASYDYGGGRQGLVGIGAISRAPLLPAGVVVTNRAPTWGGDEAETVADGERSVAATFRHRDRLVSAEDFSDITWRTPGVDLGRVEVLPLFHADPALGGVAAPGVVTVLVIPLHDPVQPDAPRADRLFLETVCRHLEPRRLVTTELHVRGPQYRGVWVSVGVEAVPGRALGPVLEAARQAVRDFLSPLTGGFDGTGWPLGKVVEAAELAAAVTRVDGVAQVTRLLLGDPDGAEVASVPMAGLELPRLVAAAVEPGDPPTLEELRSGAPAVEPNGASVVPVPVVPEEC